MRVRFFGSCVAASAAVHRRRDGRHVMVGQTCPGRSPCASDGRETPAELLTSYDGCRPGWRRQDLPNCQTSASADQVHYIRSRHRLHRLDLIDRRTMAAGQESIDTVAGCCERQRMGPLFRCYTPMICMDAVSNTSITPGSPMATYRCWCSRLKKMTSGAPLNCCRLTTFPDVASSVINVPSSQAQNRRCVARSKSRP